MKTVTVSSKFQVVIPEEIRKRVEVKVKQKLVVFEKKWRHTSNTSTPNKRDEHRKNIELKTVIKNTDSLIF